MESPFNMINDIFKASVDGDMSEIRRYFSVDAEIFFQDRRYDADEFSQLMANSGNRSYGIDELIVEDEAEDTFHTNCLVCAFSTNERDKAVNIHYRVFLLWTMEEGNCQIRLAAIQNEE